MSTPMIRPSILLERIGWSHAELARRLGISPATVLSWVRNDYWPDVVVDYLRHVSEAVIKIRVPVRYREDEADD